MSVWDSRDKHNAARSDTEAYRESNPGVAYQESIPTSLPLGPLGLKEFHRLAPLSNLPSTSSGCYNLSSASISTRHLTVQITKYVSHAGQI